jgi:hypothetical protein
VGALAAASFCSSPRGDSTPGAGTGSVDAPTGEVGAVITSPAVWGVGAGLSAFLDGNTMFQTSITPSASATASSKRFP